MTLKIATATDSPDHTQLDLGLKARTREPWTKEALRELRGHVKERLSNEEIADRMNTNPKRVREAIRYHIKRVRRGTALKRATTEALSKELMSRGKKVNLGEKLKWIGLAAFILSVVISIAKM